MRSIKRAAVAAAFATLAACGGGTDAANNGDNALTEGIEINQDAVNATDVNVTDVNVANVAGANAVDANAAANSANATDANAATNNAQ